jgi:hypothetical protein
MRLITAAAALVAVVAGSVIYATSRNSGSRSSQEIEATVHMDPG